MKWSAFTLVSRDNELLEASIKAMHKQEPDEHIAYIDTVLLPDPEKAIRILEDYGVLVKNQEVIWKEDHYINANMTVYRAILEAKHPWVLDCDDDDEIIGDVSDMLAICAPDVGAIYGHKIRKAPDGQAFSIPSWDVWAPFEMTGMRGSAILYNQEAFNQIYRNIDLFRGRIDPTYGYYWEYKIGYWMLRAGYRLRTCGMVMMLQNQNVERSEKMKSLKNTWYSMCVENRDKLPLLEA